MKEKSITMYDPPEGWKYGFPKQYLPKDGETVKDTLIRDGYPEKDAEFAGQHSRFWSTTVTVTTNNLTAEEAAKAGHEAEKSLIDCHENDTTRFPRFPRNMKPVILGSGFGKSPVLGAGYNLGPLQVKVKKLTPTAKLPTKAYDTDSGFDLYADAVYARQGEGYRKTDQPWMIGEGRSRTIPLGISIELPEGWGAFFMPRSGMAQNGIRVMNVFDNGFRGEAKVILYTALSTIIIKPGDKIAQMVLHPVPNVEIVEATELSETDRQSNGWGSTGR
jgi:dUTP pyrophosphatase